MKLIALSLIIGAACLAPIPIMATGSSAAADRAFSDYYKGQLRSSFSPEETRQILQLEAQKPGTPLPRLVSALYSAKVTKDHSLIPLLIQIKAQHEKLTIRALFPSSYNYVRGVDYSQKICDIVSDVLASLNHAK